MNKRQEAVAQIQGADRVAQAELLSLAGDKVKDANLRVIVEHIFFGAFANNLTVKFSTKVPTAGTNGKSIIFNPNYVNKLTTGQLYGLVLHEIAHVALGHGLRRGSREHRQWNVACDYSINQILTDAGVSLPQGALLKEKFKGWSAEQIYQYLQKKGGPTPNEEEQSRVGEVYDFPTSEGKEKRKGGKPKDSKPEADKSEAEDGKGEADADAEAGGGEPEDDAPEADGEADGEGGESGDGAGDDVDGDAPDEYEDAPAGDDDSDDDSSADTFDDDEDPFAEDWNEDEDGNELPRSDDLPSKREAKTDWQVKVSQAEMLAKGVGKMPGSLETELSEAKKSESPWVSILSDLLSTVSHMDYSYSKPNKLYGGAEVLMPGLHSLDMGPIVIAVDTSGSTFDDVTMKKIAGEIDGILSAFNFPEVHVISCDAEIQDVQVLGAGEPLDFSPKGGGGTDVVPVFNYIEEEGITPAALIYLTDLDFYRYPSAEPMFPVIWGAVKSHKYHIDRVPFGAVVNIELFN